MIKRLCDLVLSVIGLVLVAPVLLLVALLIRLDSRGPVLFRQERIGKDGRPFWIFKFRTMVENAARVGPRLTQKHDPRITRIGQILRWLKLDELPQLFNVIRGDMSLVGPRPEDPHFVRLYTAEQRAVLSVRPGVVGPSQILGRDELEMYPDAAIDTEQYYIEHILPDKLATDLAYVRSSGLWGDLKLIARGLGVTIFGAFKVKFLKLNRGRILLLAIDTLASLVVYHLAFGLKFDWSYDPKELPYLAGVSLLILIIRPPLFIYFGLYDHILRYLGTREFLAISKAVTLSSVAIVAVTFMSGLQGHSRLVFLIDWGLLILVLFGGRVALKTWVAYLRPPGESKNVLIVGANDTGAQLVSAMANYEALPYRPIGFLDADPRNRGATIHGIRVLGTLSDLPMIASLERLDLVLILLPGIVSASLRDAVRYCGSKNIEYRLVPSLDRILNGTVAVPELDDLGIGEPRVSRHSPDGLAGLKQNGNGTNGNGANGNGANGAGSNGVESRQAPAVIRGQKREEPTVLVTGGAGYIGSHVVRKLLARKARVRVVDNYLYGDQGLRDLLGHPRLEVIEGDIRHLRTITVATRGADCVIALAALVGDAACDLDMDETISTNLEATRLLAEGCQRSGVRRLVFASSCSVYGANSEVSLNEGSWLKPVSLYARTRIHSEEYLLRCKDQLSVTILRLATVFGLSKRMRLDLLVNTFTANAFFTRKIQVCGGGQWRPNVHVQDAAEAFIAAAEAEDEKVRGEIFNVGDDACNHSVLDIARLVQREVPRVTIEIVDGSHDERDYRVSFEKIRHLLDFRPRFTVSDGIREMARAFRTGKITDIGDERYHNFRYLKAHGFEPASHMGGTATRIGMGA